MKLNPPIVVFVRPQAAGNIGALSRVMSNFGCRDLRLVGESPVYAHRPEDPFSRMDWAMATTRGVPVLRGSRWYSDLSAALAGVHLVVGTSGRSAHFERGYARSMVDPEAAFASVAEAQAKVGTGLPGGNEADVFTWALVLGPEDDGLSDHEAALCQCLVRIATVDEAPSINVAMATGCLLYHWHLWNLRPKPEAAAAKPTASTTPEVPSPFPRHENSRFTEAGRGEWATHDQKERFLKYLMETVAQTSFLKYPDKEAVEARVRRWLQVGQIPLGELLFAFEIVYHLRAWGTGRFEKRDFLGSVKSE